MSLRIDRVQLEIEIKGDKSRLELAKLEKEANKIKRAMRGMKEGSNEYIAESKKLSEVQARMQKLHKQIGINNMSITELTKRQRELNAVFKRMTPGTKKYIEYKNELIKINTRLKELRGNAKTAGGALGRMADGVNKYFRLFAGFAGSIFLIGNRLDKAADAFNRYEERVDNLQSLTGLAAKELEFLKETSKDLSTSVTEDGVRITQSAESIIDAYTKMGSQRPELLKNKEALASVTEDSIILAEASKKGLEPAVTALATSLNQFNLEATESRRVINAIAAGSKAGAGDIDFISTAMEKSGTAFNSAKVEIEDSIAAIETLAPKMTEPARAGTQLRNVLIKLQTGADKFNPAVVGMSKSLENLQKEELTVAELTKMFGVENIIAIQTLIDGRSEFERYKVAVTDTNIAIEQATINTDNNNAKLAQSKNRINVAAIALGEKLAPAQLGMSNLLASSIEKLVIIVKWIDEHKKGLIIAASAIAAYMAVTKASEIANSKFISGIKNAVKAVKAFTTALKGNPMGLLAAAAAVAITAFIAFRSELNKSAVSAKKFFETLETEKQQMNDLFDIVKKSKEGSKARKEAIIELNKEYGKYLPNLLTEKSSLEDIEKAQKAANNALIKSIAIKARQQDIEESTKELIESQKEAVENIIDPIKSRKSAQAAGLAFKEYNDIINDSVELLKRINEESLTNSEIIEASRPIKEKELEFIDKYGTDSRALSLATQRSINAFKDQQTAIKEIDQFYTAFIGTLEEVKKATGGADGPGGVGAAFVPDEDTIAKLDERMIKLFRARNKRLSDSNQEQLNAIAVRHVKEIEIVRKAMEDKEISIADGNKRIAEIDSIFQDEFTSAQAKQEKKRLDKILKSKEDHISKLHELELLRQQSFHLSEEEFNNARIQIEKDYQQEVHDLKKELGILSIDELQQIELDKLKELHDQKILNEEAFEKAVTEVNKKYSEIRAEEDRKAREEKLEGIRNTIATAQVVTAAFTDFFGAMKDKELMIAGDNEEEKKKILKKFADKEFIATAAAIAADTAASIMAALTLPPPGGEIAAVARGITGAGQLLVANTERKRVQQLEKGRYDVIGNDDGKKYSVPYTNRLKTGIVNEPVLVGEKPEIVIDPKTTRNILINYPQVRDGIIHARRTAQFQSGDFSAINNESVNPSQVNTNENKELFMKMISVMENWPKELIAYVPKDQTPNIRDNIVELQEIESDAAGGN